MARETRYRVLYVDEKDNEVYITRTSTPFTICSWRAPLAPPPNIKRTEVWMTHLLFSTPES